MTMIERVARAICEDEWGKNTWLHVSNYSRKKATRAARAAIEAMRESTWEQRIAGRDALTWDEEDMPSTDDVQVIFGTMIDKALAP